MPCLPGHVGDVPRLGDPLVDEYLAFLAARARRNTLLARARIGCLRPDRGPPLVGDRLPALAPP